MKGSSTIELVLIFPWLLLLLVGMIAAVVWSLSGNLMQYAAYQGARAASVYAFSGGEQTVKAIVPQAKVGIDSTKTFWVKRTLRRWFAPLRLSAPNPITFSLEGVTLNLDEQGKKDSWGYSLLDNWIGFCGTKGRYGLCEP